MKRLLDRAYAVVVVGHRENVFCHLPQVLHCASFDALRPGIPSVG